MNQGPQDDAARAADPSTPQTELHRLAGSRPELRAQIARNPNAYPELLQWLGSLGDPEVDAALRERRAGPPAPPPAEEQATRPLPAAGPAPSAGTPQQPTEVFGAVQHPQAGRHEEEASDVDERVYGSAAAAGAGAYPYWEQQPAEPAPYGYAPAGYDQAYPAAAYAEEHPRRRGGAGVLVFLLALITAGALAASFFLLFGNPFTPDEETTQAQQPAPQEQPAEEEQPTEDAQPTGEPSPEESPSPTDEPDEEESPSPTEDESPSPTEDEDEEEEDENLARPAPGNALSLGSFSAPSGNIHCQLGEDAALCSIDEHHFSTPTECENGATVRIPREGTAQFACSESVGSSGDVLNYGQVSANDDFACVATRANFECWSQQSGNGFRVAREYFDPYRN
ncbi:hypothetical protein [Nesterenkonia sp.]|uniref:variant leucine-rich repeat-containing protein n=1 Tax=Nesterenkonia sp. TaxID=704201 RepID=UPI00262D172B|nr:hypothetical protein [Nesterenkonia sp.]